MSCCDYISGTFYQTLRASKWFSDLLILMSLICIGISATVFLPLRTALELGPDEGYEMMKALLISQGHALYGSFWNDQPPVYTEILAILFRVFGPSAFVARALNVCCSMVLLWSVYVIMAREFDRVCGLITIVYLALSNSFLNLSVAAMLELPTMAIGMASAAAAKTYARNGRQIALCCSGALFAIALQIKLTSIVLLPGIILVIVMSRGRETFLVFSVKTELLMRINAAVQWCIACVFVFSVIQLCYFSDEVLSIYWKSHVGGQIEAEAGEMADNVFRLRSLLRDNPLVLTAGMGIVFALIWGTREVMFPSLLLITTIVVHWFHRPYWWYYAIHFSIPLALLSGYGTWRVTALLTCDASPRLMVKCMQIMLSLVWSILICRSVIFSGENTILDYKKIMSSRSATSSDEISFLQAGENRIPWVYTDRVIYAFWALKPVPPEVAVIPWKRIASHQITSDDLTRCLERYRPDRILLLEPSFLTDGAQEYIDHVFNRYDRISGAYIRRTK